MNHGFQSCPGDFRPIKIGRCIMTVPVAQVTYFDSIGNLTYRVVAAEYSDGSVGGGRCWEYSWKRRRFEMLNRCHGHLQNERAPRAGSNESRTYIIDPSVHTLYVRSVFAPRSLRETRRSRKKRNAGRGSGSGETIHHPEVKDKNFTRGRRVPKRSRDEESIISSLWFSFSQAQSHVVGYEPIGST